MSIHISLLGTIQVRGGDQLITIQGTQATVLAYLACQTQPVERATLAQLFYPRSSTRRARATISNMVLRLRKELGEQYILRDYHTVSLAWEQGIEVDIHAFRDRLKRATLAWKAKSQGNSAVIAQVADILMLYQGQFAERAFVPESIKLESWLTYQRQEYSGLFREWSLRLGRLCLTQERWSLAEAVLSHAREFDPFDETIARLWLKVLSGQHRWEEVKAAAQNYRKQVRREFGWDVSAEYKALERQLLNAQSLSVAAKADQPGKSYKGIRPHIGAIFGRDKMAARIERKLLASDTRLISLVGLGGVGKTVLAQKLGLRLAAVFDDGVSFVTLADVPIEGDVTEHVALAIAEALELPPGANVAPQDAVLATLKNKEKLLIVDNMEEHVAAALWLVSLLQQIPRLHILVTSRARLNVAVESVEVVASLPVPRLEDAFISQQLNPSIQMYTSRAQQVLAEFEVTPENMADVIEICELTGGLPLALELAASWSALLTPDHIAADLRSSQALLFTDQPDVPQRQREMEGILWATWQRLTAVAQQLLASISVFAGVFDREAMVAVLSDNDGGVAAIMTQISTLVNAALVRVEAPGQFSLHPLVKQFAAKRLAESPHHLHVQQQHAHYFLGLLDLDERILESTEIQKPAVFAAIQRQQSDIFAAWRWAAGQREWRLLSSAMVSFGHFHYAALQWREGIVLLERVVEAILPESEPDKMQQRLAGQAAFYITDLYYCREPSNAQLNKWLEPSLTWLEAAGTPYEVATTNAAHGQSLVTFGVDDMKDRGVTLLHLAASLAEKEGFRGVEIDALSSLLYYYTLVGRWVEVDALDREIYPDLYKYHLQGSSMALKACAISLMFDRWDEAEKRIARFKDFARKLTELDQYDFFFVIHQAQLFVHWGEYHLAIPLLQDYILAYEPETKHMIPVALSLLSLCQALIGETTTALESSAQALAMVRQQNVEVILGDVLLEATTAKIISGEGASTIDLLIEGIAYGIEAPEIILSFSSLYLLVTLHVEDLPLDLYHRVVKIAVVSPIMHFNIRPFAKRRAQDENIVVDEEEKIFLFATDLEATKILVGEVAQFVPKLGKAIYFIRD